MNLDPEIEDRIDQEAWRLAGNNLAMFFHHRSLLIGEWAIYQRGENHFISYEMVKKLPQYAQAEQSVIRAWSIYVENTIGVNRKDQTDPHVTECGIFLDFLKRHPERAKDLIKTRPKVFARAAERGDTEFLIHVGRLLSGKTPSNYLQKFEYAHGLIFRWLTDYYWLMPGKLVSRRMAVGRGIADKRSAFVMAKARYDLFAHNPSLIDHFESVAGCEKPVLTQLGASLIGVRRA